MTDARRSGTIIALAFAGVVGSQTQSSAAIWLTTCWMPAEGRLSSDSSFDAVPIPSLTNQEMVAVLKDNGFPISAIAEMMGVERKTIYSWLDGAAVRDDNANRLASIYQVLKAEADGDFRQVYRVWNQAGPDGRTLRSLLSSDELDLPLVTAKLTSLRTAMSHYAQNDARRVGPVKTGRGGNPASDELPVADST
jgi:Putative ATPase subunit of terminase (gpP-like)